MDAVEWNDVHAMLKHWKLLDVVIGLVRFFDDE